jgi:diguanylate cyclase (GGDEF)-like protein
MGQDDRTRPLGDGTDLPANLVEGLLQLCQGDFSYRLQRSLLRDRDDTVAFFFNAIAEELERLIATARDNEVRMSALVERLSEALVRVASGDFSVQVERDYRGDAPDVLVFLVNNTITELAEFVAAASRRAEVDRRRLEELVNLRTRELELLATTDELTGTLSRRRILEVAAEECQRTERYPGMPCFAMFDVDHFKSINDRFGHSAGDAALRLVVTTAKGQLRQQDRIGRYGGEEFLIVFPETSVDGATRVTERVRQSVDALDLHADGTRLRLTISAGVADVSRGERVDDVLKRVDAAMYQAKAAGRNRVVSSHVTVS